MTTIAECFAGLKTVCAAVEGVNAYTTGDDVVSAPAAVVSLETVDISSDLDGTITAEFTVALLIDRTHPDQFDVLLEMVEPSSGLSIIAAFDADPTLGGLVAEAVLTSVGQFGTISYAGREHYGAILSGSIIGTTEID